VPPPPPPPGPSSPSRRPDPAPRPLVPVASPRPRPNSHRAPPPSGLPRRPPPAAGLDSRWPPPPPRVLELPWPVLAPSEDLQHGAQPGGRHLQNGARRRGPVVDTWSTRRSQAAGIPRLLSTPPSAADGGLPLRAPTLPLPHPPQISAPGSALHSGDTPSLPRPPQISTAAPCTPAMLPPSVPSVRTEKEPNRNRTERFYIRF
jgi:hypothetical protein